MNTGSLPVRKPGKLMIHEGRMAHFRLKVTESVRYTREAWDSSLPQGGEDDYTLAIFHHLFPQPTEKWSGDYARAGVVEFPPLKDVVRRCHRHTHSSSEVSSTQWQRCGMAENLER